MLDAVDVVFCVSDVTAEVTDCRVLGWVIGVTCACVTVTFGDVSEFVSCVSSLAFRL